ncbi:MAG: topoisomerase [Gammaproteobacteria bacterium]|nr:topoisomerase [Gammaproteobacteria bacterium]
MRLFIAEKPSLGRAIAASLPTPLHYQKGYIKSANGDIVTWCVGHILELAEPEYYDSRYKQWRLEDLPILPVEWKWRVKDSISLSMRAIRTERDNA